MSVKPLKPPHLYFILVTASKPAGAECVHPAAVGTQLILAGLPATTGISELMAEPDIPFTMLSLPALPRAGMSMKTICGDMHFSLSPFH